MAIYIYIWRLYIYMAVTPLFRQPKHKHSRRHSRSHCHCALPPVAIRGDVTRRDVTRRDVTRWDVDPSVVTRWDVTKGT